MNITKRPGGELATRPLHFILICDCSGSMAGGGRIQSLNYAIKNAIPEMRRVADENPNAEVLVRAIKFSNGAQWCIPQPTPVKDFKWTDLDANGQTDMGKALSMVAEQLKIPPMTERALPPVLVLVSDGQPTDDFNSGLRALMDQLWGKKAVRIAIAIVGSDDVDDDNEVLQKFIGNPELKPLKAKNSEALVAYIRWASTAVLKATSSPLVQEKGGSGTNVPIPQPPEPGLPTTEEVW